jgi:L-ascorbate metabolism protein UlaG (beta-lactamase superfamily)
MFLVGEWTLPSRFVHCRTTHVHKRTESHDGRYVFFRRCGRILAILFHEVNRGNIYFVSCSITGTKTRDDNIGMFIAKKGFECRVKINIKGRIKMKKLIRITCLLILAAINISAQEIYDAVNVNSLTSGKSLLPGQTGTQDPLVLTYVANMGVLLSSGDSKVLIDSLFDKPNPATRVPAPETIERIMKGEPPFDGIDLVLVTHKDPDHFDAALSVRYMEARSEPFLVAPSEAVEMMQKASHDWSRISSRIISIDLKVGEHIKRDVARIPLTIGRTLHDANLKTPMNLVYLIGINGWRVFHEGDTWRPDQYMEFGLTTVPVDLAVINYGWPLSPHRPFRLFFQEFYKPNHIALGHINIKEEQVAKGKIDEVRQNYKDIFVLLPGMPAKVFRK